MGFAAWKASRSSEPFWHPTSVPTRRHQGKGSHLPSPIALPTPTPPSRGGLHLLCPIIYFLLPFLPGQKRKSQRGRPEISFHPSKTTDGFLPIRKWLPGQPSINWKQFLFSPFATLTILLVPPSCLTRELIVKGFI